ncbi:MAG: hypothetical protein N3B13_12045, partial [Deltaproteobacteria bacterium]|nr:hypothetical protein [Deltaproteobacteria bacterium]
MKSLVKIPGRDELIASLIAIILPLGIIMTSTLFVIKESGETNNEKSIENRTEVFGKYAALLVSSVEQQKELSNLIRDYKNAVGLNTIAVISEESQGELAFLKKRRYIIYPGSEKENRLLSSEDKNDKRIFDLISKIDIRNMSAASKDESMIYYVRKAEKNNQTMYIYLSERLFSSSELPVPVINGLIAALISILIFAIGTVFFYNFRHAFGLIAIIAFVLYSLSGKELIKRWNASLIKDEIIELSLITDFTKGKKLN